MAEYRGFRIPEELHYDLEHHVWLRTEGDLVVVGATDPAQAYSGEIIHISIKKPGTRLERGAILATVESAKYMGPMRCPVTGTVEDVNQEAVRKPALINGDAYGIWVARVRPEKLADELGLLTPGPAAAEKYRPIIDEWGIQSSKAG
jgi:glycine cleavage system H protein